jgi:transcriptional regulator with XRE-family HTH domain
MDRGNSIGSRLEDLRKERGMTQEQVAAVLKISRALLSHWERNDREMRANDVVRLADHYGVSTDLILRGVSPENLPVNRQLGLEDAAIANLTKINAAVYGAAERSAAHEGRTDGYHDREDEICRASLAVLNEMLSNPRFNAIVRAVAELRVERGKADASSSDIGDGDQYFAEYNLREAAKELERITDKMGVGYSYQVVNQRDYLRTLTYAIEDNMRDFIKHVTMGRANKKSET